MNKINVQQTGGFPLETDTLNAMQNAYDVFNSLGNIVAPLAIIKGCEITGNQVANGVVYINGEIFEFRGGQASATVIIKEETTNRNFENGENKVVYRTRYATFGNSVQTTNYNWVDFHRPMTIKEIQKRLMPVGCIVLDYYGSVEDIPTGYQLCDGTNGTPDLRGLFIVGYDPRDTDYNAIGNNGGVKEVILSENQIPKHKHSGTTTTDGAHSHTGLTFEGSNRDNGDPGNLITTAPSESNGNRTQSNATTGSGGSHSHKFETSEIGNNQPHENRPPFYTLAKITYIG